MEATPPILVDAKEAARLLGLNVFTIYNLLDRGELECRYQGRKRSVLYSSITAYVERLSEVAPQKVAAP